MGSSGQRSAVRDPSHTPEQTDPALSERGLAAARRLIEAVARAGRRELGVVQMVTTRARYEGARLRIAAVHCIVDGVPPPPALCRAVAAQAALVLAIARARSCPCRATASARRR